ncbi:LysR family transcriptional regulator [Candidatus Thiothrix sp. Deng01]|uniref:LysR family transcriptional regulator n=1 Tax=Candidatus Thiothrix phosphatis TaxID=3112415 RepID=A0ABU6CU32_9GAMM|nr:LysR family transcriptional regulator [Candidatus Thiothrix sp. Deng01]MEB4590323.1 LysR family transcriptional regulator [Candidatus Thiothrix sp. Deng01]
MHISFRQIQIFQAVAQTENFTRAAELLHMTQPAISMQVKQLEDNVGLSLFERQGKRIVMTAAGKAMHAYGCELLAQYQGMVETLKELKNVHQGYIKVSAATTSIYFITRMLASFSKMHEGITVSLDITNRRALVEQLQHYEADLVVMGEPPANLDLHSQRLMCNPLVLIAPIDHPLAGKKEIPIADIAGEKFVVREPGSGTRAAIERFFAEHGHTFSSTLEMSSNESIKYSVIAGLGLGIVSLHSIKLELETRSLAILDVQGFPIQRYWHIVTRDGKWLSPAAQAFKEYVIAEAAAYAQDYQQLLLHTLP